MKDDSDTLAELCTVASEMEAPWIAGYLMERGVPARSFPIGTSAYGGYGRTRIVVRRRDLEKARELLRAREEELKAFDPSSIDWSEVDTGDRTPLREDEVNPPELRLICPECGYQPEFHVQGMFCPRCGVRSLLKEYDSQSPAERLALWVFAAIMAVIVLGLIAVVGL